MAQPPACVTYAFTARLPVILTLMEIVLRVRS